MIILSKAKIWSTFIICLLSIIFAIPSFVSQKTFEKLPPWLQHSVSLGLELRGGSHIQLEVGINEVMKELQEEVIDSVRKELRKKNIQYTRMSVQRTSTGSQILIKLKDQSAINEVKKILNKVEKELQVSTNGNEIVAVISKKFIDAHEKKIVDESIEVIRHRIDETGTKEPTILRQGSNRIVVQLPGIEDPAEVKRLLGKTAILTFHAVDEELENVVAKDGEKPELQSKSGVVYMPEKKGEDMVNWVPIKKQISMTGKHLTDAQMNIDPKSGGACISLKFDSGEGTRKLAELSAKYLHKQFAIVLDDKVLMAPVFQAVLNQGNAQVTGHFTMKEAQEIALLLRAGSLPAPLTVIEERNVGPSLGADSISAGATATVMSFILVALFMILSYGKFGAFACVSLVMNVMILFACLTSLGATLTLPGIAGIALTIGTAVDANVLIYERMREEMRLGIKHTVAIAQGYKMAIGTILDSNFTTLIGALFLYEFGSGPIRGFSVTLFLGTVISLFTTFFLTKSIVALWLRRHQQDEQIVI